MIRKKIADREKTLSDNSLKIDDNPGNKVQINVLTLQDKNYLGDFSADNRILNKHFGVEIPEGGYVQFGSDKKTRIFSADGVQIFFSDDTDTEKVMTPSGEIIPATHSISIPSGATIHYKGKNVHITHKGNLLLTIIDEEHNNTHKDSSRENINTISNVPLNEDTFQPATIGQSWVAWAQNKPMAELHSFSSDWALPNSPAKAPYPMEVPSNIIFNGIEPSDTSTILQPVTGFHYNGHRERNSSGIDTFDWRNKWTGAAWAVRPNVAIHSSPISLSEGDGATGFMYYIPDTEEWIVILMGHGTTTQKSTYMFCDVKPNDVNLVLTYEAYFNDTRLNPPQFPVPSDQAKCGDISFYSIHAWDKYTNEIPISWISKYNVDTIYHPGLTGISVDNTTEAPSRITIYTTPPSAPGADFEVDTTTSGIAPMAVSCRDTSINNPTSRLWAFGDGQTSTEKNPVHMYTSSGFFDVSLTVTNPAGNSTLTRTDLINVESPLPNQRISNGDFDITASWLTEGGSGNGGTWYPAQYISSGGQTGGYLRMDVNGGTSGWANSAMYQDVDLTNVNTLTYYLRTIESTTAGSKTIYVYLDNTLIRTIPSPSGLTSWTQYSNSVSGYSGIHRIKFYTSISNTGSGGWMKVGVDTVSAIAQITAPATEFSASQISGTVPFTVQFTDASTNNPTAWAWDFGDDHTSIEKNPSHMYTSAGTHTVKLSTANSGGSNVNIKTDYITTNPLTFTITASAGPGGNIAPSGLVNVINGEDQLFFITPSAGYQITNVFVDGTDQGAISMYPFSDVQSAHTISATFRQNLPVANFTANVTSGTMPLSVQFTDTSLKTPTTWNWSFGDGNYSIVQNPIHQFTIMGNYSVTLTAANSGGSNSITKTDYISVLPPPPIANFTSDKTSGWSPLSVQFTDTSANFPSMWNWSFGDGTWLNTTDPALRNAVHTYSNAGNYTVILRVQNVAGNSTMEKTGYLTVDILSSYWNWSNDGWSGWEHNATYSGSTCGPNTEFGPVIVNDHGEHGMEVHLNAGSATSWVCRTFLNPSGNEWNTISFTGLMSASDRPSGRWMTIEVNGQQVFGGTATQTPPGNGQMFQIQRKFTKSNNVTVRITNGQNPLWGPTFKLLYYSLKLENTSFSITSTAGSGGSISPNSIVYITQGGNQTYSITPNPGYSIADVRINGISNGSKPSYNFTNVQANQTIDALFKRTNWNWSRDGWAGWNHQIQVIGYPTGPNTEYGPVIVNGHGEHGAIIHLNAGSAKYWVWRTFTDPSGIGWNTIRFDGFNPASSVPWGRTVTIEVNGQQVFSGRGTQMPPGNGQFFTVQRSFPQSANIIVNISGIQYPAWGPISMLHYYSLNITQEGTALMRMQTSPSVTTDDYTKETERLMTNTTNAAGKYISFISTPAIIPDDNYSEAQSTENDADLIVTREASGSIKPFIIPDSNSPEVKRLITNSTARGAKDVKDKNH